MAKTWFDTLRQRVADLINPRKKTPGTISVELPGGVRWDGTGEDISKRTPSYQKLLTAVKGANWEIAPESRNIISYTPKKKTQSTKGQQLFTQPHEITSIPKGIPVAVAPPRTGLTFEERLELIKFQNDLRTASQEKLLKLRAQLEAQNKTNPSPLTQAKIALLQAQTQNIKAQTEATKKKTERTPREQEAKIKQRQQQERARLISKQLDNLYEDRRKFYSILSDLYKTRTQTTVGSDEWKKITDAINQYEKYLNEVNQRIKTLQGQLLPQQAGEAEPTEQWGEVEPLTGENVVRRPGPELPEMPEEEVITTQVPPPEQRIVGRLYLLPNGWVGRWNGEGWELVKEYEKVINR